VLEHRWFMSERSGYEVSMEDAVNDYVHHVLSVKPDEAIVMGTPPGFDDTMEIPIINVD
jgi:hypothetical protein